MGAAEPQQLDLNAIDPEGRRNAKQIAFVVDVGLGSIHNHFRSNNFSVTNIANDCNRLIQYTSRPQATATSPEI